MSARPTFIVQASTIYWSFAVWAVVLGVVLMAAPEDWFGPSWSYFKLLPHNGFWMGVICTALGTIQLALLVRGQVAYLALGALFFLSGFVFWMAGVLLGAEGLMGHHGLMEAPFMMYVGVHKFTHSAALVNEHRRKRDLDKWVEKQ